MNTLQQDLVVEIKSLNHTDELFEVLNRAESNLNANDLEMTVKKIMTDKIQGTVTFYWRFEQSDYNETFALTVSSINWFPMEYDENRIVHNKLIAIARVMRRRAFKVRTIQVPDDPKDPNPGKDDFHWQLEILAAYNQDLGIGALLSIDCSSE